MNTQLQLSRSQVLKLSEFLQSFKSVDLVTLTADTSSGIGQSIVIHLELDNLEQVTADLTEYDRW